MKAWLPALWAPLVLAVLFWSQVAVAEVDLELRFSAREVAVGEALSVRLDAMSSDDEAPSSPELVVPDGFEVRGPSVGTRQQVSISGFNMVTQTGISATWLLTATRAGVFSIGPASVMARGQRQQAEAVRVRVFPEGQRPRARSRRRQLDPFDSLDPLGNGTGMDDLFDRLRGKSSRFDQLPEAPVDLVPEHAPDTLAFLAAHLEPRRAVVGQQLTLTIYAHGAQGLFQEAPGAREPSHPDFLAQRLVEDGSRQPAYQYTLDGQSWIAVKVREIALFPLHAGQLEVGPLEFGFLGRRYGARSGDGLRRSTRALVVEVSEPPPAGRPSGYSGDVGNFQLTALVEPRSIAVGGSISISARAKGTGRLPGALKLPEQSGVEWLEPTLRDDVATKGSTVGGSRSFNYLARLTKAGSIDLGSLSLPHYDPATGRYRVATVELGKVNVEAAPADAVLATPARAPAGPRLFESVAFRPTLTPRGSRAYWADGGAFFWLLGAGPTFVLGAAGLLELTRRLKKRSARREQSQATHATRALADARRALSGEELGSVASAAERAIYSAIEWATGLRARALLRSELTQTLERAGLSRELAQQSGELLDSSGALRRGEADRARAAALVREVESLVRDLVRRPARESGPEPRVEEVRP